MKPTLTVMLLAAGCALQAQNPLSSELKQHYTGVKNNLMKMADKVPDAKYDYKPAPTVRTFGQLIAHVADSQARTCSAVNGDPKNLNAASKTAKADLVAALKESFAICDAAYDSLNDATAAQMVKTPRGEVSKLGALYRNVSHSNEEYGYMAVYLRMNDIVPPSSEGR